MKHLKLFEAYREESYSDAIDFIRGKNNTHFSEVEIDKIESVLGLHFYQANAKDGVWLGAQHLKNPPTHRLIIGDEKNKSISFYKFDDEWFVIFYTNLQYNYMRSFICDQFDEFIDCISMIKNKGWLKNILDSRII